MTKIHNYWVMCLTPTVPERRPPICSILAHYEGKVSEPPYLRRGRETGFSGHALVDYPPGSSAPGHCIVEELITPPCIWDLGSKCGLNCLVGVDVTSSFNFF